MSQRKTLQQGQRQDGDDAFLGVNQLLAPADLKPGEVADAVNARFRYGKAEPRLGPIKLPWTNRVTEGASSVPVPFVTMYGAGVFRDEDDNQWAMIAADGRVYRTRENNGATEVALPPGVQITDDVHFEQTYNGIVLFRGTALSELYLKNLDDGFMEMPQSTAALEANVVSGTGTENPSDGTHIIPNAARGDWIAGRMFIPYVTATEKDLVAISDYNNATRYASVRSQARINQGSSDELVRVFHFGRSNAALAFKSASVYALYGISGALEDMNQDQVTASYGLAAAKAVVNVGRDEADAPDEVWFLAKGHGICRITYDQDGRLGVGAVPVSAEIKKIVERIEWDSIDGATFAFWDNKFYGAIPLDDATAIGPELVRDFSYSPGTFTVIPGATYQWTKGDNDEGLINGSETFTESAEFTAQGIQITIIGVGTITASLKRLFKNVNNAVVVFDFLKGKWCGVDTGGAVAVQDWIKMKFDGREHLFYLGVDGFINLAEWDAFDDTAYEGFTSALAGLVFAISYPSSGVISCAVLPGRQYVYKLNSDIDSILNGSETLTASEGQFTAQTSVIYFQGTALDPFTVPTLQLVTWTLEPAHVEFSVTSRLLRDSSLGPLRPTWGAVHLNSWDPTYTISELTEGANESFERVTGRTRSRRNYLKPFTKTPWDLTNRLDDHATPQRQDYSVEISDQTTASGSIQAGKLYYVEGNPSGDIDAACSVRYNGIVYNCHDTFVGVAGVTTYTVVSGSPVVYGPGSYVYLDGAGIDFDQVQEFWEDVRLRGQDRRFQLKLENTQGRCEVLDWELFTMETQPNAFPV